MEKSKFQNLTIFLDKFVKRFRFIEKKIGELNKSIIESNLEEMDKFWEESKDLE